MTSSPPARLALCSSLFVAVTLAVTSCASPASPPPASSADPGAATDHGEIAGASEVAEAPLGILSVDAEGSVGLLDLLDASGVALDAVGAPSGLDTDGRYAFISVDGGLSIVDSGRWSWDHTDHFHYYRAEPRSVGVVAGGGPATVTTGLLSSAGSTAVRFEGSQEVVLLDNTALADGRIVELFRLPVSSDSAVIAPLGDGAAVADGGRVTHHARDGSATGASAECDGADGAITTRAALVIGCADGALLVEDRGGDASFEHIPYPTGAPAQPATAFSGRKGRPTVAGIAGAQGFWLLDTREKRWSLVPTAVPLAAVTAVDDADGHVVAVDQEGRLRVFTAETGAELAATEPLVDPSASTWSLTVDDQRAYLNEPSSGVVFEIDYADGGRIARTLTPVVPALYVGEVGR